MQHEIGRYIRYDGYEYRTIAGNRTKNDMLHQFRPIGWPRWHTPKIAHQLITVTQKYDTEENNYPRSLGLEGGQRLLNALARACETSWETVAEEIEREAFNAALRRKESCD
jgi:hypothetical protein